MHDWNNFCRALRRTYMDVSAQGKYIQDKLRDFTKESCKHHQCKEEDVLQYYRWFQLLSKPLLDANLLTPRQCNIAFWFYYHPKDRQILQHRLTSTPLTLNMSSKLPKPPSPATHWYHSTHKTLGSNLITMMTTRKNTNIDKKNVIRGTPIVTGTRSVTTAGIPLPLAIDHKERIDEKILSATNIGCKRGHHTPALPRSKPKMFASRTQHANRRNKQ
jgi:hypothetical protein